MYGDGWADEYGWAGGEGWYAPAGVCVLARLLARRWRDAVKAWDGVIWWKPGGRTGAGVVCMMIGGAAGARVCAAVPGLMAVRGSDWLN